MRTFGACLAIIGAILGLIIWAPGWVMLIIGLLIMIAAPNKVKVEQAKPASRQSTGGYAGLTKKSSHSVKHLGKGSRKEQLKSEDPWGNRKLLGE